MTVRDVGVAGVSPDGEEDVPERAVSGVHPSFSAVYQQYFDFVWSCTRRLGIEPGAMDDVVQDVFIVVHGKLHTLERPESLRSWIYGIVRRTVSTHRRASRTRAAAGITAGLDLDVEAPGPNPFEQTEQNAELQLLSQLLGALDEPKREIFALVELEEFTVPEAAEALQIPLNTAYSRLRAARQAFESALARVEQRSKGS
jgi:RNA polymerase sigma-70 factor (ECF subfamily)